MSTIQFQCPQGHPLTALAEQAGLEAKCPTCGTLLRVPIPTAATPAGSSTTPPASPQTPAPAPVPAGRQAVFYFYCPAGHKLNGPVTLAGRPGKCPHCGSRFVIPSPELDEEQGDTTDASTDFHAAASPPFSGTVPQPPDSTNDPADDDSALTEAQSLREMEGDVEDTVCSDAEIPIGELVDEEELAPRSPYSDVRPTREGIVLDTIGQPTDLSWPQFFAWAWQRRSQEHDVEILLKDGERLRPVWYAAELSQRDFAVFAVADDPDSYVVMAVRWDDMQRILLRGVQQLPQPFHE